jgi:D-alanine-D-alanine ligase
MTAYRRIAVLMGGRSAEREVSLSSGRGVMKALAEEGFAPVSVDPGDNHSSENLWQQLWEAKPDAVFNALHGRFGEDGTVQGLLELMRLPYTHSGVLSSALAMHKERTKDVYRAAGLPVVKSIVVDRHAAAREHLMEPPYVVKPVNEGSSVGIFIIRKGDNRPPAELGSETWNLSSEMMVEEFVPGRELTVAVMGGSSHGRDGALGVTEITTELEFYDYEAKYAPNGSKHILPADLPRAVSDQAMDLAVAAHKALGCRGVSRTDFRYDDTGASNSSKGPRLILLETNTQPGMTPTALVPEQAAHVGISYAKLCRWMVEDASCDR